MNQCRRTTPEQPWLMRIEHRVDANTSQLIGGHQTLRFNDIARYGFFHHS